MKDAVRPGLTFNRPMPDAPIEQAEDAVIAWIKGDIIIATRALFSGASKPDAWWKVVKDTLKVKWMAIDALRAGGFDNYTNDLQEATSKKVAQEWNELYEILQNAEYGDRVERDRFMRLVMSFAEKK